MTLRATQRLLTPWGFSNPRAGVYKGSRTSEHLHNPPNRPLPGTAAARRHRVPKQHTAQTAPQRPPRCVSRPRSQLAQQVHASGSPESPQPSPRLPLPRGSTFCARECRLMSTSEAHMSAHLRVGLSGGEVHVPVKVQTCLHSVCAVCGPCPRVYRVHPYTCLPHLRCLSAWPHQSPSSVSASAQH